MAILLSILSLPNWVVWLVLILWTLSI